MNSPIKYQVFDQPVPLSSKDEQRLQPYLSGWNKLVRALNLPVVEADLQRLIMLELAGKRRRPILEKLVVRLTKVRKQTLQRRIDYFLQC